MWGRRRTPCIRASQTVSNSSGFSSASGSVATTNEPVVIDPATQQVLGTVTEWYAEFHSGPLPSARELERYEQVSPGLSGLIVNQWRGETTHRRRLEQFTLTSQVRAQTRGQIFGLLIALVVIAIGAAAIFTGHSTAGLVALIGPLVALTVNHCRPTVPA